MLTGRLVNGDIKASRRSSMLVPAKEVIGSVNAFNKSEKVPPVSFERGSLITEPIHS